MKLSKVKILLICAVLIYCSGCLGGQDKVSMIPLTFLDTVVTQQFHGKDYKSKLVYYKILEYKDNDETLRAIEDFIKKHHGDDLDKYESYSIGFYYPPDDESDEVELKNHPDRYYNLDNLVYEFRWANGKLLSKTKYKDGKIIGKKSKVTVTDVPIPPNER